MANTSDGIRRNYSKSTMAKYKPGEIVDIVGGTYRKYKTGTFQHKAGLASASITVHGIEETHSIRLA